MSRVSAIVMGALLMLYLGLVAQLALRFISVADPVSKTIGIALLVLPLVGLWALVVEFVFGLRSARLGRRLAAEGPDPFENAPRLPSGRIERGAADATFGQFQADVEASPDSWQAWYRLGLAYDACGDRRRARGAIRRSIALERSSLAHGTL